jgi:YVTN family beta-propeller protein
MKIHQILILLAVVILFSACSSEEKLIDNTDSEWEILAATDDAKVMHIEMPSQDILSQDVMTVVLSEPAGGNIEKITEFRNNVYFFIPDVYKIIVADKFDFTKVAEIDFSTTQLVPTDICFPNATAAYVTHSNAASVSLVDITTFQVVRQIAVGDSPREIAAAGNQVYVCNQAGHSCSVIDTRTNEVAATIGVSPNPTYVGVNSAKTEMVVVSLGFGKTDSASKSPAMVTFIDIESRTKVAETPLGFGAVDPNEQHPMGLAVSPKDWAFIPTKDYLLRVDARFHDRVMLASRKLFPEIYYDHKVEKMFMMGSAEGGRQLALGDPIAAQYENLYILPYDFTTAHLISGYTLND